MASVMYSINFNYQLSFIFIAMAFSMVIAIAVGFLTRGITFFGNRTDNHHHVSVASKLRLMAWPSEMHVGSPGSAAMKVLPVYLLAIFQRLMGDKKGERPLTVLCITANFSSAICIFFISVNYWGYEVALPVTILFVSSFWPWMLSLHGGPITVSQMCVLISVLFFQYASGYSSVELVMLLYFFGGFSLGLSQFSSGSARKYIPISLAAFIFGFWDTRTTFSFTQAYLFNSSGIHIGIWFILLLLIALVVVLFLYKPAIKSIYDGSVPPLFSGLFPSFFASLSEEIKRSNFELEHYHLKGGKIVKKVSRLIGYIITYTLIVSYLFGTKIFFLSHLFLILGLFSAVFWLTCPEVGRNLLLFFKFATADKWAPRFPAYRGFFNNIGKPISNDMRGAGIRWIYAYLNRISPFHFYFFITSSIFLLIYAVFWEKSLELLLGSTLIFIISCSPLIVAEVTRAPQMGRSYFPVFIGLLVTIAFSLSIANQVLPQEWRAPYWSFLYGFLILGFIWNASIFLRDVLPARMAPARLAAFLKDSKVNELYTYDTSYNNAFLGAVPTDVLIGIDVRCIQSLREVNSGLIVVPGTSARAFNMESETWAIKHGDFDLDPDLTYLIESKLIEKCAVTSFKTFGTSRMWGHESEVVSYLDLILGLIGDKDRHRGKAWILDAEKVCYILKGSLATGL